MEQYIIVFPEHFSTSRCQLTKARSEDIACVEQIFKENYPLLESIGIGLSPYELAEDAVFNQTLPPAGLPDHAATYVITSQQQSSIIGIAEYYVGYPTAQSLYIGKLYFREAAKRTGYGTETVLAIEAIAQEMGLEQALVTVNVPNWGALWFWSRIGYKTIHGAYGPASAPDGALVLSKQL